jgi:hypothetical protein
MTHHPITPHISAASVLLAVAGFAGEASAQGSSETVYEPLPTAYVGTLVLPEPLVCDSDWPGDEISGIAWKRDPYAPNWMYRLLLVPDDRSQQAPARIAVVDHRSWVPSMYFEGIEWITLIDEHGEPFAKNTVDPEAVRIDHLEGPIYWASEGYAKSGIQPALYASPLDGSASTKFPLPDAFLHDRAEDPKRGIRHNNGFESLALDHWNEEGWNPDGPTLLTCVERPLIQDEGSGVCRMLHLDPNSGKTRQFGYRLGPPPAGTDPDTMAVAELLSTRAPGQYLVLENAEREDGITVASLWLARLDGAEDLSDTASLRDRRMRRHAEKKLILDFSTIPNEAGIGNLEGMELINDVLYLVEDNEVDVTTATRLIMVRIAEDVLDGTVWDDAGAGKDDGDTAD